jgi:hypothetical protein
MSHLLGSIGALLEALQSSDGLGLMFATLTLRGSDEQAKYKHTLWTIHHISKLEFSYHVHSIFA